MGGERLEPGATGRLRGRAREALHCALGSPPLSTCEAIAMRRLSGLLLLAVLLPHTALAKAAPGPGQARAAALQAALDQWAARPGHHGVSAAVIWADGREWVGAAGHEDSSSAMRPEHLLPLASITKTMTGAVILQLAEERRLSLDDSVSRWLGTRPNLAPGVTIRQLLNHTSGVGSYDGGALIRARADRRHVFTADELIAALPAPQFTPGERTLYTNSAFVILARVAEHVTGQPMHRLLRERLWAPSRLTEIFMVGHEPAPGPVPRAYSLWGHVQPLDDLSRITVGHGAGAVYASARAVARWGRALFGDSLLSPATQRAMRTLVPAAGNIPGESGAGLGIRGYDFGGRRQLGHSGGSPFGSSLMLYDPDRRITVAVLTNQATGADHFVLAPALLELASAP